MTTYLTRLDKSKREQLIKEIQNMEMFDELTYCIGDGDRDLNYVIKLNQGYLFKAKYADNYVYISEVDFV